MSTTLASGEAGDAQVKKLISRVLKGWHVRRVDLQGDVATACEVEGPPRMADVLGADEESQDIRTLGGLAAAWENWEY